MNAIQVAGLLIASVLGAIVIVVLGSVAGYLLGFVMTSIFEGINAWVAS